MMKTNKQSSSHMDGMLTSMEITVTVPWQVVRCKPAIWSGSAVVN